MTLNDLQGLIDIDVAGSLARFSNFEPMYLKYLKRFVTEPTYDALKDAIAAQDFKGIVGNLGLTALYHGFDEIVQDVRAGRNDAALQKCAEIDPKVIAVRQAIAQLD